ncbi:UNVERIFIED_CONTAM: Retrovirus-related Pol polyprotein from transposon TNT 1-94 [Sesamum latifolium]|uniref:Retrovirus-related Pol polyprotein from transposon TNT 1-94 n=1 Tax=Sesamum latifolium TaxID=2727402 RepID=A0AAW2SSN7_9LAMI
MEMASSSTKIPEAKTMVTGSGSDNAAVRIQTVEILVLKPLPNVNKAYSMAMRVERQRQVNLQFSEFGDNSAIHVRTYDQRKQSNNGRTYIIAETEQKPVDKVDVTRNNLVSDLLEDLRVVQTKIPHDPLTINFAQVNEMTGMTVHNFDLAGCDSSSWIVDTGATCHMRGDKRLFHSFTSLKFPQLISLPGNSTTLTTHYGDVQFTPKLTLTNVFYVLSFRNNLLFVCHLHASHDLVSSHNAFSAALSTELHALEQNETSDVVDLPKGKKAIDNKWVYKVKLNPDGSVERYKARLIAKGYNQIERIDYFDRFSSMAKSVTVRTLLAVASASDWVIYQVDINNAFFHGFLDEDIYMLAPDGYSVLARGVHQNCMIAPTDWPTQTAPQLAG